jgi:hypothetical protein
MSSINLLEQVAVEELAARVTVHIVENALACCLFVLDLVRFGFAATAAMIHS